MCWNDKVSLNTFIFGTIAAIIALILNKFPLSILLLVYTISLIQLMEYFAWRNIHNKKKLFYISIFGALIILLQVILITYNYLKGNERNYVFILILFLAFIAFYYNFKYHKFHMEKGENGHLKWLWADLPLPLLILGLILWIYPPIRKRNILVSISIILTLSISLYNYFKYKTWGSMWCYIGNIFWIFVIIKSIYLYINNKDYK